MASQIWACRRLTNFFTCVVTLVMLLLVLHWFASGLENSPGHEKNGLLGRRRHMPMCPLCISMRRGLITILCP